ncbi:hypothetical protein Alg130_10080 [Pyrenophora tritici-repentis]|nr:hypothetical protein Alg130_10080 [Pyrenophora tritici-repentis]
MTNCVALNQTIETKKNLLEHRRRRNRISQRKRRELQRKLKEQALSRGPGSAFTESRLAPIEQQDQQEKALTGESCWRAPAHSHGSLAVQPSTSTSSCSSWDSTTIAEYTSPFEDGYALLRGGPAWDCTGTTGTQKDEST